MTDYYNSTVANGKRSALPEPEFSVIDAEGDSLSLWPQMPDGGGILVMAFRDTLITPLIIHHSAYPDALAEYRRTSDYIASGDDASEECWHGQCVCGSHPLSAQHADATGFTFVQPRREA